MSPIYVRPEREQAEHDRLIRFLQTTYSEQFEVVANPGDERIAPVKIAAGTHFPDLVLGDGKRVVGIVEIETAASVNNLETMAKWVPFSRARVLFHLYVPVLGYEAAVRLAEAHHVKASEIWTYRPASEGFDLVRMYVDPSVARREPVKAVAAKAKPVAEKTPAAKPVAAVPAVAVAPAKAAKAAAKPEKPAAKPEKLAKAEKPAAKPEKSAKRTAVIAKVKPKAKAPARVAPRKAVAAPARNAKTARPKAAAKSSAKGGATKKGTGARKKR